MASRSTQRIACLVIPPAHAEAPLEALAEACMRFSPQVAIRPQEAVFLEIGGSRNLFTEESLAARLRALAARFGVVKVSVGISRSVGAALALARFGCKRRDALPLEALADFLSPFYALDPDLRKAFDKMLQALYALGISNVGEFKAIPVPEFASRFGKQACEMHARVLGSIEPAWQGFYLPEKIIETSDTECQDLQALLFVLKDPVDRAMARLRGRGERAARVTVALELELWSVLSGSEDTKREIEVGLALPQGSASGLVPILQERLARELEKKPLGSPVQKVCFEVIETVPGRDAQRDFLCKKEEENENLESIVARLSERLGKDRVFQAVPVPRYLPEKAYARELLLSEGKEQSSNSAPPLRPTRLLKNPERLERRGPYISIFGGKRWKSVLWQGPERLSGEWWSKEESFNRDYYRVITQQGDQLWIFLDRNDQGAAYLHGFFD